MLFDNCSLGPLVIEVQQVAKPMRRVAQKRMPEGETVKLKQVYRGVLRTQSNICNGAFLRSAVNCCRKNVPSQMFDWVRNTQAILLIFLRMNTTYFVFMKCEEIFFDILKELENMHLYIYIYPLVLVLSFLPIQRLFQFLLPTKSKYLTQKKNCTATSFLVQVNQVRIFILIANT